MRDRWPRPSHPLSRRRLLTALAGLGVGLGVGLGSGASGVAEMGVAAGGDPDQAGSPGDSGDPMRKVTFDLDQIDPTGLSGPPGGQVAVGYEFCIPATPGHLAEVQGIDPGVRAQPGSPGRIGCGPGQVLFLGSTHQPGWRSVLERLAALDYVARIDRFWGE
jgi:hypothetical protein